MSFTEGYDHFWIQRKVHSQVDDYELVIRSFTIEEERTSSNRRMNSSGEWLIESRASFIQIVIHWFFHQWTMCRSKSPTNLCFQPKRFVRSVSQSVIHGPRPNALTSLSTFQFRQDFLHDLREQLRRSSRSLTLKIFLLDRGHFSAKTFNSKSIESKTDR